MQKTNRSSCVLIGDGSLLVQCGEVLQARGFEIAAVITESTTVSDWARSHALTTIAPSLRLSLDLDIEFDWFFSIANLAILPKALWGRARKGAINFHDGPLPRSAGLNTPAWAIINGHTEHGVTWHALTEGIDEGDIYAARRVEISEGETALSLNTKCFEAGIETFAELISRIETQELVGRPQDTSSRTYYAKQARPKNAAIIDFTAPTSEIDRLVRGLHFGAGYANPLALPKVRTPSGIFNVTAIETSARSVSAATARPGTVTAICSLGATIATRDGAIRIEGLSDALGQPREIASVLEVGSVLAQPSAAETARLEEMTRVLAKSESYFEAKLAVARNPEISGVQPAATSHGVYETIRLPLAAPLAGTSAVAAVAAFIARISGQARFEIAFADDALSALAAEFPGLVAPSVPLSVAPDDAASLDVITAAVAEEIADLKRRKAYVGDLVARSRKITAAPLSVGVRVTRDLASAQAIGGTALTFVVPEEGGELALMFDTARLAGTDARSLASALRPATDAATSGTKVADLPLVSPADLSWLLNERNATEIAYDRHKLVHKLIEEQADRTPDATAIICEGKSLTYAELDARANRVAHNLIANGAGPETLVGLYLRRSADLVVGALAIMKAGAAYVPLDPAYPADRIALIVDDSGLALILTERALMPAVPTPSATSLAIEDAAVAGPSARPETTACADHLAYVIYTSGSTGRPKGVMVEHRNVVNFFAGMDRRVPHTSEPQPVWLAVTSLSFDISVLELFWTLTRGFAVVVHVDTKAAASDAAVHRPRLALKPGAMDFSLFFWGNNDGVGRQAYKLLLDSARFADTHGFNAVWMPERHFHAFGGPYPNPAVTGAAIAAITENIEIRAGSCVLPLHHPARVAEDWAVIDNLSNGRTGLAFAAGWMPEDFLLRPENAPPNNKAAMLRDIDIVRRLWRGESVPFAAPGGKEVAVVTQPRPVSKELQVWVTTAGNPETYRDAGRMGAHLLTHLLGQSIDELAGKIEIYRQALAEAGHDPAAFKVTLMLHTLVGHDREAVRDLAREPMKAYLKSAAALIKQYAWAFPAFKKPAGVANHADVDLRTLSEEELDAIIEFAFLRYFDDSGLFGTVDDALTRVHQLTAIGVNEIGCLIDFGISTDVALEGLKPLAEVVAAINPPAAVETVEAPADFSLPALIRRHGVTHLQCTPAMAAMLLMDGEARKALADVRHLFIGGEALTGALLRDLKHVTGATIENMYGPTETTIWSSTGPVHAIEATAPLGEPIANTQLYVLDDKQRPVPLGMPGELFIGGDGVARGYRNREDLTRERFLPNPFVAGGRMYRTGDLVRLTRDSGMLFVGRTDHQVKVRGYRIELGEIEARIAEHPAVQEAVVIVRHDNANDARIVAYIRYKGAALSAEALREHLKQTLPDFMVPAHFVAMTSFPLTPNAKVDRNALPRPGEIHARIEPHTAAENQAPQGDLQIKIAASFTRVLGLEKVGMNDNFFAIGGHSLLAVQMHRDLKASLAPSLTITDIYRFPTVAGLASHLANSGEPNKQLSQAADRAAQRRAALTGRRVTTTPRPHERASG